MIYILFGLAGSGKNYTGQTLAKHFGFYFFDGDQLLSEDLRNSLREKKLFTEPQRDEFTQRMIAKITELQKNNPNIVFAQALYKQKNREQLQKAFPDAKFILIESTKENIAQRLKKRNDWIDEAYAEKMRVQFDRPTFIVKVILNNGGEGDILRQFE